jgi:hypothetical protein
MVLDTPFLRLQAVTGAVLPTEMTPYDTTSKLHRQVTPEACCAELGDASEAQLKTLSDWEAKFAAKYGVVGTLLPEPAAS